MKTNLFIVNGKIEGYQTKPLDLTKPVYDLTQDELDHIQFGYDSIKNGHIVKGKAPVKLNLERERKELSILYDWFKWYDTQAIQYARDMRYNKKSNINILQLDKEAYEKAARVKELEKVLK